MTLQAPDFPYPKLSLNLRDPDCNDHADDAPLNSPIFPSTAISQYFANNNFNQEITTIFPPDPPPAPNIPQTFDPPASLKAAHSSLSEPNNSPGLSAGQRQATALARCDSFSTTTPPEARFNALPPRQPVAFLSPSATQTNSTETLRQLSELGRALAAAEARLNALPPLQPVALLSSTAQPNSTAPHSSTNG